MLEAGDEPTGSWPRYYDSLRLFSPSEYSGFPGYAFPGQPAATPARDEVVSFLRGYASWLGVDIRTGARVEDVTTDGDRFVAHLHDGTTVGGDALVAASGSFANPYVPEVRGREGFAGEVLHVADYRSTLPHAGKRVVVVGAGNSAVQVGYELAAVADTTPRCAPRSSSSPRSATAGTSTFWLDKLKLDLLPPAALARLIKGTPVLDAGDYRVAVESGRLPQRPVFTGFTPDGIVCADGTKNRSTS